MVKRKSGYGICIYYAAAAFVKLGFSGEFNHESTGLKASLVQREVARECVTEGL